MKRYIVALLIIAIHSLTANHSLAQRAQDWVKLGDEALSAGDSYGALRYYGEAMKADSSRALHNYKYAEALRYNHQYEKAAYYYYKVYRRDMDKSYPEGGAMLAEMQKQSGNYADSKNTWRRVRDRHKSEPEGYWYQKAVQEMRACDLAMTWSKEEPTATVKSIPPEVNTEASEFAGVISRKGDLIYASLSGNYDDKGRLTDATENYQTRLMKADSLFKNPMAFDPIGVDGVQANYALNEAETFQAIVRQNTNGANEIYIQDISSGKPWIKVLPTEGDSAWYSHPAFAKIDGKEVLIFSSDRTGGYGARDLWSIDLNTVDVQAVNLGEMVNTPGDEITPHYRSDQQRLYFASNWHYGFGGFDIFYADYNGAVFGYPENLKMPFNSPANDLYYSFATSRLRGTLTSNRKQSIRSENEGCCNDLYYFDEAGKEAEPEDLIATLEDLNKYLPVKLYFHNDEPDPRTTTPTTKRDYIDTYRKYTGMLAEYEEEYRSGLSDTEGEAAEEAIDRFFIDEIDQGVEDLELFTSLLLGELNEGARIEVTVKGFASPLARTDYNVKLTSRRISSLRNYLNVYERGALRPYLDGSAPNGGLLRIVEIPFGEYKADGFVSDNPNDRSGSIYSIAAARERKIEITSVQRATNDSLFADVRFISEIADLGSIQHGGTGNFEFNFSVYGTVEFTVDSVKFDALSMTMENIRNVYSVNENYTLKGIYHGNSEKGKRNSIISIYGNIAGGRKELNIALEIE
jgi:hypothetical protein